MLPITAFGQITINNNASTVEHYIQNVLIGNGVSVSNIQFNWGANIVNKQIGSLTDNNISTNDLHSGLIMGSEKVN